MTTSIKSVLFLILSSVLLSANPNNIYKVDLFQYAEIVSSATHQNILIDNKVPAKEIYFYAPAKLSKSDYLQTFRDLLKDCKLRLIHRKNYYYVTLPLKTPENLYHYTFQNLNVDEVRFITRVYPQTKFQFFKNSNTLYYVSDFKTHKQIQSICKNLDLPYTSKDIKLTIFITDLKKLKSSGIKYEKFQFDISGLANITQNAFNFDYNALFQFKGLLDLLQKNKIIDIVQSPILHLTDDKPISFNVVKNIPIVVSFTQVKDNQVVSQNSYEYRDVGLKIKIKPNIFHDYLFLDLNLTSESIDTLSDTPITNRLNLQNSFKLKDGHAILLTGLNISQNTKHHYKIPILGDLPYVHPLFNSTTQEKRDQILSILIEVIKEKKAAEPAAE